LNKWGGAKERGEAGKKASTEGKKGLRKKAEEEKGR
jgi:hypothetical protein